MSKLYEYIAEDMIVEGIDPETILEFMCKADIIETSNLNSIDSYLVTEINREEIFSLCYLKEDINLFDFSPDTVVNEYNKLISEISSTSRFGRVVNKSKHLANLRGDAPIKTTLSSQFAAGQEVSRRLETLKAGRAARAKALKQGLSGAKADEMARNAIKQTRQKLRASSAATIRSIRKGVDMGTKLKTNIGNISSKIGRNKGKAGIVAAAGLAAAGYAKHRMKKKKSANA